MDDSKQAFVYVQDMVFIAISVFYCIFGDTFFHATNTARSLDINNIINCFLSLAFLLAQVSRIPWALKDEINLASTLVVLYNLIPVLLQQKSMFGMFVLLEIALSATLFLTLCRNELTPVAYSQRERLCMA